MGISLSKLIFGGALERGKLQIDGLLALGRSEMVWNEGTQTEEVVGTGHVVLWEGIWS